MANGLEWFTITRKRYRVKYLIEKKASGRASILWKESIDTV